MNRTNGGLLTSSTPIVFAILISALGCGNPSSATSELYRAPAPSSTIDGVVHQAGNWEPHLAAGSEGQSWGNHRAVVTISDEATTAAAVSVTIPWRRRDDNPADKSIVVVDASTGQPVTNAIATRVDNTSGDIVFQPNPGQETYHVYYLPWSSTGGYYPVISYDLEAESVDAMWRQQAMSPGVTLPSAQTTAIESVDDFHTFFPMEIIASPEQTATFMSRTADGWEVVPEHRDFPIRMRTFLPQHWTEGEAVPEFHSRVLRDEYFTLQLGLVAGEEPLSDIRISYDGFPASWVESFTCFSCEGVDLNGESFIKAVNVPGGSIQPLWIGINIPADQAAGAVTGSLTVATSNRGSKSIPVTLEVMPAVAINHGTDSPELMTRLAWLNSTTGRDPDYIIAPFTPVDISGRSVSVLGRTVALGSSGLPTEINSFFTPELTTFSEEPDPILASPLELQVTVNGTRTAFEATTEFEIDRLGAGAVAWTSENRAEGLTMVVNGQMEYDGWLNYEIQLIATVDTNIDDVVLPISYTPDAARYMLGLGRMGGLRPESVDWTWAIEKHQEGVWLGGIHKGLQYVLRDETYIRPLNTNFYQNQPLRMPSSWFNEGRGGIQISESPSTSGAPGVVTARNYSGPRTMAAGDTLHFNVRFLITPFKPIDTVEHFNTRFVHQYTPVDSVVEWGGTVVNIHHANEINPYINYPFFGLDKQGAYIEEAHAKGIKVKLYNTIRELTYRAHELFALRSLGDEILNDGEGGGHSWMQEHLEDNYHAAWHAWRVDDAAMLNKGTSRWTNYYIEGLSWLAENQEIDGLYLDDIAFSRETVKRIVAVLDEHRDEVVIDLHSANQFNDRDGFINSAMLYMEHFPFISRLWFGEYFDYDQDENYWMTEVAGLPFGLMGEMLQDGGHPYRGMLYGMTSRKYGTVDPRPVWEFMNDFGIAESELKGYWLEDAPVVVDHPRILATTYVRSDGIFIALASWSDQDEVVEVTLDMAGLGLSAGASARAPEVRGLQTASPVDLSAVVVPANQGLFIRVEGKR